MLEPVADDVGIGGGKVQNMIGLVENKNLEDTSCPKAPLLRLPTPSNRASKRKSFAAAETQRKAWNSANGLLRAVSYDHPGQRRVLGLRAWWMKPVIGPVAVLLEGHRSED